MRVLVTLMDRKGGNVNPKDVELFLEGEDAVEAWSESHSCAVLDLSGADLSGLILNGRTFFNCDLEGADLSDAQLFRADLSECNLKKANLREAALVTANLNCADLEGADMTGAHVGGATFWRADLTRVRGLESVEGLGACILAEARGLSRAQKEAYVSAVRVWMGLGKSRPIKRTAAAKARKGKKQGLKKAGRP